LTFEIVGEIEGMETFAVHRSIRERWRKRKGFARVRLRAGIEREAEIHWSEARGMVARN